MTPEVKKQRTEKIIELLRPMIERAISINEDTPSGIEIHKPIAFLLEKFNTGKYYGTIEMKITGTSIHNPTENNVTHRLDMSYQIE
ncbi:MAG TPA: hypothetical protein VI815_03045 [Candidatus Nanoarchaeia archaeon]|nr:hypothetical protein [Candidatus Nanoarchaeia archaeon]